METIDHFAHAPLTTDRMPEPEDFTSRFHGVRVTKTATMPTPADFGMTYEDEPF